RSPSLLATQGCSTTHGMPRRSSLPPSLSLAFVVAIPFAQVLSLLCCSRVTCHHCTVPFTRVHRRRPFRWRPVGAPSPLLALVVVNDCPSFSSIEF
ncbi:hypothetical protein S83_046387, partial [Arachis hypogaea]